MAGSGGSGVGSARSVSRSSATMMVPTHDVSAQPSRVAHLRHIALRHARLLGIAHNTSPGSSLPRAGPTAPGTGVIRCIPMTDLVTWETLL